MADALGELEYKGAACLLCRTRWQPVLHSRAQLAEPLRPAVLIPAASTVLRLTAALRAKAAQLTAAGGGKVWTAKMVEQALYERTHAPGGGP